MPVELVILCWTPSDGHCLTYASSDSGNIKTRGVTALDYSGAHLQALNPPRPVGAEKIAKTLSLTGPSTSGNWPPMLEVKKSTHLHCIKTL